MVLNKWEDNPHADYELHHDEESDVAEVDEKTNEVLNKIHSKDDIIEAKYEVVEEVQGDVDNYLNDFIVGDEL